MRSLLSFIDNTPTSQPHESPKPALRQPRTISGSPKTALLVEDAECLSSFLRRYLEEEGYAVRTAFTSGEGLRLYRDFGPFNVVLINYDVPQSRGAKIDPTEPRTNGIELALAIRGINSAQGMVISAISFTSPTEVPRPTEAMDIPVLVDLSVLKLRRLLEKIEVDRAINALTSAELLGLQITAKSLIRVIGRSARGRDWEDLLGEALYRSLIGAGDPQNGRHWNRKVGKEGFERNGDVTPTTLLSDGWHGDLGQVKLGVLLYGLWWQSRGRWVMLWSAAWKIRFVTFAPNWYVPRMAAQSLNLSQPNSGRL